MTPPTSRRAAAVEVLYFDGCPNYEALASNLRALVDRVGVEAELRLRRIESEEQARRLRFLGSPTVRIDGRDVEPEADARLDYGLSCRLYRTPDGIAGEPPDALILAALGERPSAERSWSRQGEWAPTARDLAIGAPLEHRLDDCPDAFRDLHRSLLRVFLEGRIPDADELQRRARELGTDLDEALVAFERRDVVWLDPDGGSVVVAYPFSGTPTPHEVHLSDSGRRVFAMCALDALGIPFLARRPATIRSREPGTRAAIEVRIDPAGGREWEPEGAVVIAALSGAGPSATRCCPHINFATSRRRAEELVHEPTMTGRVLEMREAIDLARHLFGALLDAPVRDRAPTPRPDKPRPKTFRS